MNLEYLEDPNSIDTINSGGIAFAQTPTNRFYVLGIKSHTCFAARLVARTCDVHGVELEITTAPWWSTWPISARVKPYKKSKLANFLCDVRREGRIEFGGTRRLDRNLRICKANELGQVGQVQHRANTTKQGSWPTRSNLANFFDRLRCPGRFQGRSIIQGSRQIGSGFLSRAREKECTGRQLAHTIPFNLRKL